MGQVIARMIVTAHALDLAADIAQDGFNSTSNQMTVISFELKTDEQLFFLVDRSYQVAGLRDLEKKK